MLSDQTTGDSLAGRPRLRARGLSLSTLAFWIATCLSSGCAHSSRAPAPVLKQEPVWPEAQSAKKEPALPVPEPTLELTPEPLPEPVAPPEIERAPLAGPDEVLRSHLGEPFGLIARSEAAPSGLFLLDVGSEWVPALLRSAPDLPHGYERVFADLANDRFDSSQEGRRAAQERYLEVHGIPPSPALLERRFSALVDKPCSSQLALQPFAEFAGVAWEEGKRPSVPEEIVVALQARLACEGHLRVAPSGVLDDDTRRAVEEFQRRNRIYARGNLDGETLEALRAEPLELERRALVRVLSERMVLELGVIEDGSAIGASPARKGDEVENAPDVVRRVQERVVEAFGLQSVAGAARFYRRLDGLLAAAHTEIAIDAIELPDYHAADMELWVEIDRGDLYYEFPFDQAGNPLGFRIERGPTLTVFARDQQRVRPLALYPTTIGGWRVRRHNNAAYWAYKESPVGLRAWKRIVTAPVWLPPASTPWETLVLKFRDTSYGREFYELNQNLVGPSFASAYGLVAAHHQRVVAREGGELELRGDDGMRTHGSSDYTSIWRSVSSGCHRLHNHLATRLLSFILAHRAHRRVGHLPTRYRLPVSAPDFRSVIDVTRTGYVFDLARPLEVRILPGRIRGQLQHPLKRLIPAPDNEASRPTLLVTPSAPAPSNPRGDFSEQDETGQDGVFLPEETP